LGALTVKLILKKQKRMNIMTTKQIKTWI